MRWVLISIIGLVLWLPLAQMGSNLVKIEPIFENRNRARPPTLKDVRSGFTGAYQVTEEWFNDHYGFRDLLIRLKTEFDYRVFFTSDRLYLGKDGWMHHKVVLDESIPKIEAMTSSEIDRAVSSLVELRDYLSRRGIKLIVIFAPLAERLHPETVPSDAPQVPVNSKSAIFRRAVAERLGSQFIDAFAVLEPIAKETLVYNKNDWHWNDIGNYEVTRTLVDSIARFERQQLPFWRDPLDVIPGEMYGGGARQLPLFRPIIEMSPQFRRAWDFSTPTRPIAIDQNVPNYEAVTRLKNGGAAQLPTTVAYGDSFLGRMLRAGLPNYFRAFYFTGVRTPMKAVLGDLPPDAKYFVYEFFEPRVPNLVNLLRLPES